MKNIKMELLRKKLENFWAKFFNATNVYEINHKWKQRKMKSSKEWSSQLWTQFMQLRKRNLKKLLNISTGFEPVTSRYQCKALTNWAMKPLMLGAGNKWQQRGSFFTWLTFLSCKKRCWSLEKCKNFVFECCSQFLKLSPPESLKQRLRKYRKWPTFG